MPFDAVAVCVFPVKLKCNGHCCCRNRPTILAAGLSMCLLPGSTDRSVSSYHNAYTRAATVDTLLHKSTLVVDMKSYFGVKRSGKRFEQPRHYCGLACTACKLTVRTYPEYERSFTPGEMHICSAPLPRESAAYLECHQNWPDQGCQQTHQVSCKSLEQAYRHR